MVKNKKHGVDEKISGFYKFGESIVKLTINT